ncbi:phosphate ABC transporter substrate-binding protein [Halomonas sp. ISL-60]|uniref:PstS family phosphate ABC transporter substrate-binding protein n=1 Tax=unclassified Halomonas TaxID=2609666 RepID=UPI000EB60C23|nr:MULTISPECIES: phosphate ABC transporter substrate-binding protein [unclassified Halomonas]MBT2772272.1 phosphate ABC transporter substrate-binding protein [Halomonas sp. ISL-60]MBT2789072.1 phosphate ABC transporter substrate-binding protein [Halomonas sp. ISL-106]MBT2799690.1 phosphate ABC transporter substrate-binding protein [Halomonas sp. ISL-104]MBT2800709.1 phosphate ABC transporter substrate-binding protein [Halomonas sp. ISL-56]
MSGTLGAVGSDTMAGLMLRWGETLTTRYPEVKLQFQASGSASAPTALVAGTTRLGPMSRPMTADERDNFIERYGYPPLELKVARDALIVVVHRHNPLRTLTRQQVDAIFSTSRACGGEAPIRRWEQLPATRDWSFGHIALHGRNLASGTHGLFQERALCGGQFRNDISEHPGSSAVVAAVGESANAMGYAGFNHLTPAVHALSLYNDEGTAIPPDEASVQSGDYPLSRYLYLYVNQPPGETLPPPEQAFLRLILSEEGQQIARASGFVPLTQTVIREQQKRP